MSEVDTERAHSALVALRDVVGSMEFSPPEGMGLHQQNAAEVLDELVDALGLVPRTGSPAAPVEDCSAVLTTAAELGKDAHVLDMLNRAVANLIVLEAEYRGDARMFRLRAQDLTDTIRQLCDQVDGYRELAELDAAAKFTLDALRSAEANGADYGNSALGQALRKLAAVVDRA